MLNFHSIMLIAHVLISAAIIGLVLLQRGKGADAGAAFGAGASGTVFGARGSSNFLSRSTAILALLFFLSSLSLAYLGSRQAPTESLMDGSESGGINVVPSVNDPATGFESVSDADLLPTVPTAEGMSVTGDLPPVPESERTEEATP